MKPLQRQNAAQCLDRFEILYRYPCNHINLQSLLVRLYIIIIALQPAVKCLSNCLIKPSDISANKYITLERLGLFRITCKVY
jgi:hypothetical protein